MKAAIKLSTPKTSALIMRKKCNCGRPVGPTGECAECRRKRLGIQTKLTVNQPGDRYEQEADRVADIVMRMPEPCLQRQVEPNEEEEDEELLQRKFLLQGRVSGRDAGDGAAPPIVQKVLHSPGERIDAAMRAFMEPRFGYDLETGVRSFKLTKFNIAGFLKYVPGMKATCYKKNFLRA